MQKAYLNNTWFNELSFDPIPVIRPINCNVNLELDTKPEQSGYSTPKLVLSLVLQEIAIQLSKSQYHDIMEMLESFERMVLADKYRKYRRHLPPNPSRKQWCVAV